MCNSSVTLEWNSILPLIIYRFLRPDLSFSWFLFFSSLFSEEVLLVIKFRVLLLLTNFPSRWGDMFGMWVFFFQQFFKYDCNWWTVSCCGSHSIFKLFSHFNSFFLESRFYLVHEIFFCNYSIKLCFGFIFHEEEKSANLYIYN